MMNGVPDAAITIGSAVVEDSASEDSAGNKTETLQAAAATIRLLLLNPNTNAATTAAMLNIAQQEVQRQQNEATEAMVQTVLEGSTVPTGAQLIYNQEMLAAAAEGVEHFLTFEPGVTGGRGDGGGKGMHDGVIIAAFGDPGLERSRRLCACPVTGIGEAAITLAAENKRRFAIVTTTPLLVNSIQAKVEALGFQAQFCGVFLTEGDMQAVMGDAKELETALAEACNRAVQEGRAEAIVIGGGPLAVAARAIAAQCPVPIIEPIPAAVRLAQARALTALGKLS